MLRVELYRHLIGFYVREPGPAAPDIEIDTPPLANIGIGQLIASIDHSWDTRDQIRAKVGRRLPELKRGASQTNEFLMRLLRTRPSR